MFLLDAGYRRSVHKLSNRFCSGACSQWLEVLYDRSTTSSPPQSFSCYCLSARLSGMGCRWMVGLSGVPAVVQIIGMCYLPESPRYLVSKDKIDEAREVLARVLNEVSSVFKIFLCRLVSICFFFVFVCYSLVVFATQLDQSPHSTAVEAELNDIINSIAIEVFLKASALWLYM